MVQSSGPPPPYFSPNKTSRPRALLSQVRILNVTKNKEHSFWYQKIYIKICQIL